MKNEYNNEYNNLTYDVIFIFFLYSFYNDYAFRFRFVVLFLEPCLDTDTVFVFSRDNAWLFTAYVTGTVFVSLLSLVVVALFTVFISIGLISIFSTAIELDRVRDGDRIRGDRVDIGNRFRTLIFLRFNCDLRLRIFWTRVLARSNGTYRKNSLWYSGFDLSFFNSWYLTALSLRSDSNVSCFP